MEVEMKKKFKVGDRVRCIYDNPGVNTKGKTGTVREITTYGYGVEFDENVGGHNLTSYSPVELCKYGYGWYVLDVEVEAAPNEVIVIHRKGDEVIAHNKVTSEKATSKCHPDDKFDFMIGAKIAFNRLVNPTKIVKQDKYEVGDKVKIIDKWVDGCYENSEGYMDKWLGKTMTIIDILSNGDYKMKEDNSENCGLGWYWNSECIEGKVVDASEPQPEPKKLYNGKVVCVETKNMYLTTGKIYEFKDGVSKYDDGDKFPLHKPPVDSLKTLNSFGIAKFIELVE